MLQFFTLIAIRCFHVYALQLAELCSPVSESANPGHLRSEQRDTPEDVLLFLVQHSGTHSHCLLVIHH